VPQISELILISWPALLTAVARAVGFAAAAPVLGIGNNVRGRMILTVLLSLILLPTVAMTGVENSMPELFVQVAGNLSAGLLFGFLLRALVAGACIAARLVDQQLAIPVASELDDEQATALAQLFHLLTLALFFSVGGHRIVIAGLLIVPTAPEGIGLTAPALTEAASSILMNATWVAIQIAGPVALSLLTANIAVGMIARMLPRFSVPSNALPGQIAFGLVLVMLSIAAMGPIFGREMVSALDWLRALI